ncbi:MAG: PEGA domain-containing protein, partial [Betaproteobacteria bacterium]
PTAGALAAELAALHDELQRAAPPAAGAVAALAAARRLARDSRSAEALAALRAIVSDHPEYVEARRALRLALREQARREKPAPAAPDGYPELEATFQATATRRAAGTGLLPTVVVPASGASAERPAGVADAASRRAWLWAALALAVVATLAAFVLLRDSRPAPAPLRLAVRSQPVGASVLVDGRDSGLLTNGELRLPSPLPARVVLTFRKAGHRDEIRTVALPPADAGGVSVTLEATVPLLTLKTDPPGAAVTVDGARVAGVTPLQLALDPGSEHRLVASLDGYLPQEARVAKGESESTLELALPKLAPPGSVAISSSYPLDVVWRGRPLAKATLSPRVSVAGGRQQLTLLAPSVFLRLETAVNVVSGGEVTLDAPSLGRLNVRANPDNCEIFVDGAFVDYPPILDRPAAAGRHTVAFRWPDGRRHEETVEVRRGSPAFVFGRKE